MAPRRSGCLKIFGMKVRSFRLWSCLSCQENYPPIMWHSEKLNHRANHHINVQEGPSLISMTVKSSGNLKRGCEELVGAMNFRPLI